MSSLTCCMGVLQGLELPLVTQLPCRTILCSKLLSLEHALRQSELSAPLLFFMESVQMPGKIAVQLTLYD